MLLTFFLIPIDVCVCCVRARVRACMPLNYLTCDNNGAIEMQHNNNHNRGLKKQILFIPRETTVLGIRY